MKRFSIFIIVILIICSGRAYSQVKRSVIDSIYKDTLRFSDYSDSFYRSKILALANYMKSDSSNISFPYSKFEKVVCYSINGEYFKSYTGSFCFSIVDFETGEICKDYSQKVTLNSDQVKRLLMIINDPLAFDYGACTTAIPKLGFVFYSRDHKIVGYFDVGCNYNQISSIFPDYIVVKEGSFVTESARIFRKLIQDIGIKGVEN